MMRRVEDVLDCWFESGSMPFAQVHYPFENAEWFEGHFPADFIVEYVGQTRGWFYTLHVLGTALFDKPPFCNCMAHGVVLGDDKQKLSKRLRNYPDPDEMFSVYGADAMRWFLLSSPVMRGGDLVVERKGPAEAVRRCLNPLWNAWKFFAMYANADGYQADVAHRRRPRSSTVTSCPKLALLVDEVTEAMDAYDLYGACGPITAFLDALNNWYIRRSRDRFWSRVGASQASDESKTAAYDTSTRCSTPSACTVAPLLPMLSETVYRGLTGERSVHLADWPDASGAAAGRRSGRPHGHRPRRVLGRPLRPQGARAPGPFASGVGHRGAAPGRLRLSPVPRPDRRRAQRQGGQPGERCEPTWPTSCSRSTRRCSALAWARPPST